MQNTKLIEKHHAAIAFMKPKHLLPPDDGETGSQARRRMLAEIVHEYLCEHRPNHWRSRRELDARMVELNKTLGNHPIVSTPSEQELLTAIKVERRRRDLMAAWTASLTPAAVEAIILVLEVQSPGRVVRLRLPGEDAVDRRPLAI